MSQLNIDFKETIPVGQLGIIPLQSSWELGKKVNEYIVSWRKERESAHSGNILFENYKQDTYIIDAKCSRFGSGEAKGTINESIRGKDLYLIVDVTNYNIEYKLCGHMNRMSPDDHYSDLKRLIAAASGKARRINVIMPFLYESRQHKRTARESLDCALALQELMSMGVENIITFDAHDPRVQNAIPMSGFESIQPNYHANVLGIDMGMFYKRRDYSRVVDGRNPIVAHEFLGASVEGKDVVIIDDMISSGESMLDTARELKKRKANRVFVASTFGLFTNGLAAFDKAYEEGTISKILTTNCIYQSPELLSRPYYVNVDLSKYIALLIDSLNHDHSISELLDPNEKIHKLLNKYNNHEI